MPVRLGPRYRSLGAIASGGMGNVVLARKHDASGASQPVAIKQLHAHLVHDPQMVAMFIDEARITSRLDHRNIVRVHDVEMLGEHLVIVMEYVEGVSLNELLSTLRARGASMPIPIAARIIADAAHGLHAAHELTDDTGRPIGLVHRDASPHNFLVATNGVTRVTDFGVAMAAGRLASTQADGVVKGKLQYLSPEQVYRKNVDRRADVFAAGIVLWECLTGRKLFTGANEGETLAAVLREPIEPPSTHRVDVPLDLDEICLRALERDPDRRFRDAAELARALESVGVASAAEVGSFVEELAADVLARHRAMLSAAESGSNGTFAHVVEEHPSTAPSAATQRLPRKQRTGLTLALGALVVGSVVGGALVWIGRPQPASRTVSAPEPAAPSPVVASAAPAAAAAPSASLASADEPAPADSTVSSPVTKSVAKPSGTRAPRGGGKRAPDGGRARPFMPDDL
jgi:serine/threonine-protein kinase